MTELLFTLAIGLLIFYYQAAMRCKEIAVAAARAYCKLGGVQLLDQTVHQVRISLSRDLEGRWRIWRRYRFDYSIEGEDRAQGEVIILGRRVQETRLHLPVVH